VGQVTAKQIEGGTLGIVLYPSNNCEIKLFSYAYSKIRENLEEEKQYFPTSTLVENSLIGESKHGVTSSCKHNYFRKNTV